MNIHNPQWHRMVRYAEYILAMGVAVGVVLMSIATIEVLIGMDWRNIDTFYEMMRRVLAIVIGLEFIRILVTHSLTVVLELLAFVIARKMLLPDLRAVDILLSVFAFVVLLIARHIILGRTESESYTEQ